MQSVVLISVNEVTNYGQRCISSVLKQNGMEVYNIFFGAEILQEKTDTTGSDKEFSCLVDLLEKLNPFIIGMSVFSIFSHLLAEKMTSVIKSSVKVPVVWGGAHPILLPEFCLDHAEIDYVCIGEGEESMLELCQCMLSGKATDNVPGIMPRKTRTYTRRNPPENLDNLPFQDIGNENKYCILHDGSLQEGDPFLIGLSAFVTKCSRGCPFSCSFCSNAAFRDLYDRGTYLRRRSVDNVIDELNLYIQQNPGCNHVWFWDDTFPSNRVWIKEFAGEYKKHIGIPFSFWLNPNTTVEQNIEYLSDAGLTTVTLGIQSASSVTREKVFFRTETEAHIFNAHRILLKYGIEIRYDFILEHPWESKTELEDTFKFVASLQKPFRINMHSMILLPKTALAETAVEEGYTTEENIIENIINDPFTASRKFQWRKGIPVQKDLTRAFWIFLIMCAENPALPVWLLKFLSNSKILRKYPMVLAGKEIIDLRKPDHGILAYVNSYHSLCGRYAFLQKLFQKFPRLKETTEKLIMSNKLVLPFFISYLGYRLLTKFPVIIMSSPDKASS